MSFSKFQLNSSILNVIQECEFKNPTPIQEKSLPIALEGKDIMAQAQTGSGKTACFIIPIIESLLKTKGEAKAKIKALIIAPTRELSLQIEQNFKLFSKYSDKRLKIVSLIGGEKIGDQLLSIQKGCDVVVSTAGRLIDILSKKQINLSNLDFFVLDEADKMLNQDFTEQIDEILKHIPSVRQNLLFSATYPQKILDIASKITKNPVEIKIEQEQPIVEKINQRVIEVNKVNRSMLLRQIIKDEGYKSVLVFMATKKACENIAAKFRKYGFEAESFHGDLDQVERNITLKEFKENDINILFSTDIAARGLHIDNISCVVNFDLPRSTADYVHRIGRTARAGKSGVAISFIDYEDFEHFKLIEKRCKINLKREQISGFELIGNAPIKKKGNAPVKGKRKSKKDKLREQQNKEK